MKRALENPNGYGPTADTIEEHIKIRNHAKVFKIFHTRAEATSYSQEQFKGCLAMFGLDKYTKKSEGKKQFISTSFAEFWKQYFQLPPGARCFYEIFIPTHGCHFYMDIDVCKIANATPDDINGMEPEFNDLLDITIELMVSHGFVDSKDKVKVVILDSSNESKFSRHVIFKMEGKYFTDNFHCGAFFRIIQNTITEKYGKIGDLENKFFKWNKGEVEKVFDYNKLNRIFMGDAGVYTTFRQFRILGSTKWQQKRPLHLLGKNETDIITLEDFLNSLATNVDLKRSIPVICLELDGSLPFSTSNKRLFRGDPEIELRSIFNSPSKQRKLTNIKQESIGDHPIFDAVAKFIKEVWADGHDIRCKSWIPETKTIRLETFSKNCHIKGSPHKGNNIYFMASIGKMKFYQKCLDPDEPCRFLQNRIPSGRQIGDELRKKIRNELKGHNFSPELIEIAKDFLQSLCLEEEEVMASVKSLNNMWSFME